MMVQSTAIAWFVLGMAFFAPLAFPGIALWMRCVLGM